MAMKAALVALFRGDGGVTALAGDRISWSRRVQGTPLPAIALWRVAAGVGHHSAGVSATQWALVQVDCWASSALAADQLGLAVEALVKGFMEDLAEALAEGDPLPDATIGGLFIENMRDGDDPGEGAPADGSGSDYYRSSLDIRVWSTTA